MTEPKENEFAIPEGDKESIAKRLRSLIGNRSVRAASQDWGLSFSTLNNYLTRGTEPSLNMAIKIAKVEGVTVEWLATGVSPVVDHSTESDSSETKARELLRTAWTTAFEFMGKTEAETLLRIIISVGARGLIKPEEHEATIEETFMMLPSDLKEREMDLIEVHVEAKKGASEGSELNSAQSPAHNNKRAS